MSTQQPSIISDRNLSHAWGKAFLHVYDRGPSNCAPLMLTIAGFSEELPAEDPAIRDALDAKLDSHPKCCSTAITAATIFPYRNWQWKNPEMSRERLYALYLEDMYPRIRKRNRLNQYGTYFERMINFQGVKHEGRGDLIKTINQLEQVIHDWTREREHPKRPRHSALQVSVFDPPKDLTGQALRGFPCLQQISFGYDDKGGLSLSAFYPTQYLFDRAYGNYLGLCQLGVFMAAQMGLELVRFNCFIPHPELGTTTKGDLSQLVDVVKSSLPREEDCSNATR